MPSDVAFRVINQTAKCSGPRLVVFKDLPPQGFESTFAPMPKYWLQAGFVHLVSCKGTLVPNHTLARPCVRPPEPDLRIVSQHDEAEERPPSAGASSVAVATQAGPMGSNSERDRGGTTSTLGPLIAAHAQLATLIEQQLSVRESAEGDSGASVGVGGQRPPPISRGQQELLHALLGPLRESAAALGPSAPLAAADHVEAAAGDAAGSVMSFADCEGLSFPPSPPVSSTAEGSVDAPVRGFDLDLNLEACHAEHIVGVAETMAMISLRHGVSQRELRQWNRLLSTKLMVGQRLRLEPPSEEETWVALAFPPRFGATPRANRGAKPTPLPPHLHNQPKGSPQPLNPLRAVRVPYTGPYTAEDEVESTLR